MQQQLAISRHFARHLFCEGRKKTVKKRQKIKNHPLSFCFDVLAFAAVAFCLKPKISHNELKSWWVYELSQALASWIRTQKIY